MTAALLICSRHQSFATLLLYKKNPRLHVLQNITLVCSQIPKGVKVWELLRENRITIFIYIYVCSC